MDQLSPQMTPQSENEGPREFRVSGEFKHITVYSLMFKSYLNNKNLDLYIYFYFCFILAI